MIRKENMCEFCNTNLHNSEMLVLRNEVWAEVVKKFDPTREPKHVLLCPKCILSFLGRDLEVKDILMGDNYNIPIPCNQWMVKEKGWEKIINPLIGNHINYFYYRYKLSRKETKKLWDSVI